MPRKQMILRVVVTPSPKSRSKNRELRHAVNSYLWILLEVNVHRIVRATTKRDKQKELRSISPFSV
jgi:hypothetical protein